MGCDTSFRGEGGGLATSGLCTGGGEEAGGPAIIRLCTGGGEAARAGGVKVGITAGRGKGSWPGGQQKVPCCTVIWT